MTRKCSLVAEGDRTRNSAYVPELPYHRRHRAIHRGTDRLRQGGQRAGRQPRKATSVASPRGLAVPEKARKPSVTSQGSADPRPDGRGWRNRLVFESVMFSPVREDGVEPTDGLRKGALWGIIPERTRRSGYTYKPEGTGPEEIGVGEPIGYRSQSDSVN
jgi:hypothetical protein